MGLIERVVGLDVDGGGDSGSALFYPVSLEEEVQKCDDFLKNSKVHPFKLVKEFSMQLRLMSRRLKCAPGVKYLPTANTFKYDTLSERCQFT